MKPREQWVAFGTIVVKEITRFVRIWQQSIFQPAITTSLYFVIFKASATSYDKNLVQRNSAFFTGIKLGVSTYLWYTPIFLFRRIVLAISAIYLTEYPAF